MMVEFNVTAGPRLLLDWVLAKVKIKFIFLVQKKKEK